MNSGHDIAVVGSGAAGIAAAISAARTGSSTLLFDSRPAPGGTGGFSGLTTLCGLFTDDGAFLNEGFSREFAEALQREDGVCEPVKMGRHFVQLYRPTSFQKLAAQLIAAEPRLTTCWNTPLHEVIVQDGRISSVNGIPVRAVIDCTGIAEVGRACGEELLSTDDTTQAPSVVFTLRSITRDLTTPFAVAPVLLAITRAGFPPVSFVPCVDAGEMSVKFSGTPEDAPRLVKFLQEHVPGFGQCRGTEAEFTISRRAGNMIVGRHVLSGAEVLNAQQFPDTVARGNWPIEQWSPEGRQRLRHLPEGTHYEIPTRSLQSARTENLFMAGKSMSADADAIASARVMGCCLATGAAAGQLASASLHSACAR